MMDASQTLFIMHIMDGYSFRNTLGIIKSETDYATMLLSPETIEISFISSSKCAVHKIVFFTKELTMYKYNIRDEQGNLYPQYPIAFETNEMFNTAKGIGRRDGIRLYWLSDDTKINVQPIKTSTKDPGRAGALFVNIHNMEYKCYTAPDSYSSEPNVRVQAKDFADICSQANTLKCSSLEIIGHNSAVTFKGIMPSNTLAFVNRFTSQVDVPRSQIVPTNMDEIGTLIDCLRVSNISAPMPTGLSLNIIKSEDLLTIKVPIGTVKALSKIHNISPSGTLIRLFFASGKPTKIESPIGTYGVYVICLRNGRA